MPISNNKLRLIHVARRQLDISDAEYRSALVQLTGVTTSKDLDDDGFVALLGLFEHLGFSPLSAKGENYGDRKGMASFAQIELVRVLWSEFTRHSYPGEDELNKWLFRTFKISSLRFLTKGDGQRAITALKVMKSRRAA